MRIIQKKKKKKEEREKPYFHRNPQAEHHASDKKASIDGNLENSFMNTDTKAMDSSNIASKALKDIEGSDAFINENMSQSTKLFSLTSFSVKKSRSDKKMKSLILLNF